MRKLYYIALSLFIGLLALLALFLSGPASSVEAGTNDFDGLIYFPIIAKNYDPSAVPVTLKGHVVEANGDGPIEDAKVCVGEKCDFTDLQGYYELINVLSGFRHLDVTAGGFVPISEDIYLPPDLISEMYIAMANDDLPANTLQIVLTWKGPWGYPEDSPGDLDAHLWITNTILTETFYINASDAATYRNCNDPPYACYELDDDDEDGYGPETIRVAQVQEGRTSYAVNNYYSGHPLVPLTSQTGATVRVFRGNQHINTFRVPSTGSGDLWYVFDVQKSGLTPVIVPVNCITNLPLSPLVLPACSSP